MNPLRAESPGHTLQPAALLNEWVLKLLTSESDCSTQNREHLICICIAANAMSHMLVDHARFKKAAKR